MAQSSREIVQAAIEFRRPERLPVFCGSLGVSDNAHLWQAAAKAGPNGSGAFSPVAPGADAWGCIWAQTEQHNIGQVVGHPLSGGIPEDLASTPHPDFSRDIYYEGVEAFLREAEAEGKYVQAGLYQVLFERVHMLLGFEQAMLALADPEEQPGARRLMEFILQKNLVLVDQLARRFPGRIHGICMTDDFGTQNAAFVSAPFWMEFFYPYYRRLFDHIRAAGYDVWVHSCGKINEIIECYIRAGVQVLNLQQPRALGIPEIGQRYRGRVAFDSLCDIQATLPTGRADLIARDAAELMEHWACPEGGFLLSDYGDGAAIGADPAAKAIMYREFSLQSEKLYGQPLPPLPG